MKFQRKFVNIFDVKNWSCKKSGFESNFSKREIDFKCIKKIRKWNYTRAIIQSDLI